MTARVNEQQPERLADILRDIEIAMVAIVDEVNQTDGSDEIRRVGLMSTESALRNAHNQLSHVVRWLQRDRSGDVE